MQVWWLLVLVGCSSEQTIADAPINGDGFIACACAPPLRLDPVTQDFGLVTLGASSAPVRFTVTNQAGTTLAIGAPMVQGDAFHVQATTCGATLTSTCTIDVEFTPTQVVEQDGSLAVSGPEAGAVSASLRGSGQAP